MSITKESITFACPSCGHTSRRHTVVNQLSEGKKPTCEECGREIPIDDEVLAKIEEIFQRLGLTETPDVTIEAESSVALHCPHCDTTSAVSLTLARLGEKGEVFCQHCGKEIPIDRAKIQKAQNVLGRLDLGDGDKILDVPGGPIVVKTKTFNVDVKKDIEIGEQALPGAGGPPGGTPSRPNALEPKKGCLGAMALLSLLVLLTLLTLLTLITLITQ